MSDAQRRRPQRSAQAPRERSRAGDPARRTAYGVMRAVAEGAYTNLELTQALRRARLSSRDAAFVTELVSGATRWQGRYDAIIATAASRDVGALDPAVLDTLRLGAHQILGMRVPEHAAVGETVALARSVNGIGASKLVNAVLRRISERPLEEWLERTVPADPPTARLATLHSHPEWVVKALRQALLGHGAATAETIDEELTALLEADNAAPTMHLVARPGLGAEDELRAAGAEEYALVPTAWTLPSGDPGRIAAIRDGRAGVQDAGSQLVALAVARASVSGEAADAEQRWLDLCAGPGGKAGLLGALALQEGADLVANEVSAHRAELVRSTLATLSERAAGLGRSLEVRVEDGRELGALEPGRYTRVLVDAPCTGLGALRRRPEARWRRTPSDLATLGPLQRALLDSALDATVPGGVVAYATCSPHLAETSFVVADVVKRRQDVEILDARDLFRDRDGTLLADLGDGPTVQLWPHRHGTDAMFLALLRRSAAVPSST
ncbi:MAG: RsmB/NOP family class I SAM-dependent RNA methyltransferase [Dermatophilaceae bacterium]|nr:RsmB/NOP family class I SAM-dependent RNA methyltransferase [Intrasporangiaceae bacterium]